MKIIFVYENIVTGGVYSLLLRFCKSLTKHNIESTVVCKKIDKKCKEAFINNNISFTLLRSYRQYDFKTLLNNDSNLLITFEASSYIECVSLFFKNDNTKVLLYSVHPYTFDYFRIISKYKILKMIFYNKYIEFFNNEFENSHFIFMDEDTIIYSLNSVGRECHSEKLEDYILRLIVLNDDIVAGRKEAFTNRGKSILTVTRADFPFKGYIKGLLEIFSNLKRKNEDLKLTIITSGYHVDHIKKWAGDMKDVLIIDSIAYDKLHNYYKNANLYIGMGTTILEASINGSISIPVLPYTYDCKADCLFAEKPKWLVSQADNNSNALSLIDKVLMLNANQRKEIIDNTIDEISCIYGEDEIIEKLLYFEKRASVNKRCNIVLLTYVRLKKIIKLIKGICREE